MVSKERGLSSHSYNTGDTIHKKNLIVVYRIIDRVAKQIILAVNCNKINQRLIKTTRHNTKSLSKSIKDKSTQLLPQQHEKYFEISPKQVQPFVGVLSLTYNCTETTNIKISLESTTVLAEFKYPHCVCL